MVVVSGEGGIGKTRLCEEVAAVAQARGAGVAWAACWESGGLPPFWPWLQLLDQLGTPLGPTPASDDTPAVARAELFARVSETVRQAARARPWLIVLDDLQWADPGTVRLVAHVEPVLRSVATLLVVTVRETDSAPVSLLSPVLRNALRIRLDGLSLDELADLVHGLTGARPDHDVNNALHRATAGNPLFALEMVRRLDREGRLDQLATSSDLPVSPTVRAVLDEHLADLSDPCRELLAIAAVIGREFPLGLVADVAGRDRLDVMTALEQAVNGGVVAATGIGRYQFTHPLLRSVVHDDIGVARRVRLHTRIGEVLEAEAARGGDVDLAALSFHYLNAAPGGTAAKAIDYAVRAAQAAMTALGYEDAVALYDRALSAHDLDPTSSDRGQLLLGLGEAKAACGDSQGARAAFLGAADHARRTERWADVATAALGLAGSGFEVALFDEQQLALLEEALTHAGDDDPALRSRLSARLSVALSLAGQERRRASLSDDAVRLAHAGRDGAALAGAFAARCDARAGPADVRLRSADAAEIIRIGKERGDRGTELLGRRLRLVAALEAGDVQAVDGEIGAFASVADWLRQPQYQWYVPLWRAMRAAMQGRLQERRHLAAEAEEVGRAAGSVNTAVLLVAHEWFSAVEAGEYETAVAELDRRMPPGTFHELGPQLVPVLAVRGVLSGRTEEARAVLDGAVDALAASPRDSEWLTMTAQTADAVFRLGGHDLARWLYEQLAPFADLWSVDGIGAYAHGPVHRQLGQLAALLGHSDVAATQFDAAIAGNRRAGADLLVARTLLERGLALDDDSALRSALDLYRALGVERRAEETAALIRPAPSASLAGDANVFRHEGAVWVIRFAGRQSTVRDAKGVRDIARLLAQSGREVAALDLAGEGGRARAGGDLGDVVDADARAAYRARLVELEEELDEADAAGDTERSARAAAERDALTAQLAGAYGLAGRPRRAGDPAERARTAVTARIRDAIRRIQAVHPELGRHLSRSIRTGTLCVYDPDEAVPWEL